MARFWVGGSGTWDASDTTHWSATSGGAGGASVPTSTDDVTFDTASNGTGYTCTIGAAAACANLVIGNPATGSLTLAGSSALDVYGNFSIANITRTYTGTITFKATATGKTIAFNGETMASPTVFDGVGGGWTLQDAWNNGSATITLTNGALNTNGQTVTCGSFASNNSNTRSLTLGASAITCSATGTPWNLATTTGLTFSGASSTINLTGTSGTFAGGGLTYGTLAMTGATGGKAISGANTFATLSCVGGANTSAALSVSADQVITGTLTLTGNSVGTNRLLFSSNTTGTPRTITAAVTTLTNVDFTDITAAGAGSWTGTSLGDALGNTGITFVTPVTRYWVGGTGNWGTAAEWAATSGGAGGASVPICHDNAVFDANSFTAGSQVVTANTTRLCKDMTWTGVTNNPTYTSTLTKQIYGNLTLAANMTFGGSGFNMRGRSSTHTITIAGATVTAAGFNIVSLSSSGGKYTLQDTLVATQAVSISGGTFDQNDQNMTCLGLFGSAASTPSTWMMGNGTTTVTGDDVSMGFDLGNTTVVPEGSTLRFTSTTADDVTMDPGSPGKTFNDIVFARGAGGGDVYILWTNTFNLFKDESTEAHSIFFDYNETQTVTTFTVSGTVGKLVTLDSVDIGFGKWELFKTTGVISRDYLNILNSDALGGATFYAGANSVDGGGNTGWHFNIPDIAYGFMPIMAT